MFQYRQVIVRLRQGDTDREIARSRLMGRRKVTALRRLATQLGWLSPDSLLPDDEAIAASVSPTRRAASTISTAEPFRAQVERWVAQDVGGIAIHAALKREHGFTGSYSAVRRLVTGIRAELPPETTVRLSFAPGEAAQVDFGAGPFLTDSNGVLRRTWAFVMTLCFSRHQYLEFVFDQSVPTWLGCHRRAFASARAVSMGSVGASSKPPGESKAGASDGRSGGRAVRRHADARCPRSDVRRRRMSRSVATSCRASPTAFAARLRLPT
jgi:hypothetical protein